MNSIYTVGHSNLHIDHFIGIIKKNNVNMIIDIRSVPFSRFYPQFNKERLAQSLNLANVAYVFEGDRLGGRIKDKDCFLGKQIPERKNKITEFVDYNELIQREWFIQGINSIIELSKEYCVSILCSEEQPLRCHRNLLVARYLVGLGYQVLHIRKSGETEEAAFELQQEQMRLF